MKDTEYHYIECDCTNDEHRIVITKFDDDGEIYVHYFLEQRKNIWERIKIAVKYIFGYKCKYGHFGETVLSKKEIERLKTFLEKC